MIDRMGMDEGGGARRVEEMRVEMASACVALFRHAPNSINLLAGA